MFNKYIIALKLNKLIKLQYGIITIIIVGIRPLKNYYIISKIGKTFISKTFKNTFSILEKAIK